MLISTTVYAADWPLPDFKNCDFYLKAEEIVKCGRDGSLYLKDYGYYYCNEFKRESKSWSNQARKWVEDTGQCLQEMIFDNKNKRISPCSQMEEFAFDAHPICYKQYKICDLSIDEKLKIMSVVRGIDYVTRRSISQVLNVGLACLQQYLSPEETAAKKRFEASTKNYNRQQREEVKIFFTMAPSSKSERIEYFRSALNLMLSESPEKMDRSLIGAYIESYGNTAQLQRATSDEAFFACGEAVSSSSDTTICSPSVVAKMKNLNKDDLKSLSQVISPPKMKVILNRLKNRKRNM